MSVYVDKKARRIDVRPETPLSPEIEQELDWCGFWPVVRADGRVWLRREYEDTKYEYWMLLTVLRTRLPGERVLAAAKLLSRDELD